MRSYSPINRFITCTSCFFLRINNISKQLFTKSFDGTCSHRPVSVILSNIFTEPACNGFIRLSSSALWWTNCIRLKALHVPAQTDTLSYDCASFPLVHSFRSFLKGSFRNHSLGWPTLRIPFWDYSFRAHEWWTFITWRNCSEERCDSWFHILLLLNF